MNEYILKQKQSDFRSDDFGHSDGDDIDNSDSPKRSRGAVSTKRFEREMDQLNDTLAEVMEQQEKMAEKFKRDMNQVKALLQQIAVASMTGHGKA